MTSAARPLTIGLAVALSAFVAAAFSAPPAAAGLVAGCEGQELEQPFLRWLDPANYVLAPNGGFEAGAADWTLTGGARVVAGNESFHVGGSTDASALALPVGASATSSEVCVGLLDPTVRLFVRNTGSPLSSLKVEVLAKDASGRTQSMPIGIVLGSVSWQPSAPMLFLQNLKALPLLSDGTSRVAFRITAQGLVGAWRIDDVYVDPFKGV